MLGMVANQVALLLLVMTLLSPGNQADGVTKCEVSMTNQMNQMRAEYLELYEQLRDDFQKKIYSIEAIYLGITSGVLCPAE